MSVVVNDSYGVEGKGCVKLLKSVAFNGDSGHRDGKRRVFVIDYTEKLVFGCKKGTSLL